ncbi:MAG: hypothetical protein R3330_18225, partial [Saprospiraceae bacterium]|nr:hypothetical protein [Saprospiraceae bacterium]
IVATPLSWYLGNLWLQDFAFRSSMAWWLFVSAGLIVLAMVILTVSLQSLSAAIANPVDALRDE